MRYKILHIPTGTSFQVIGAHAKSLERFREEFKACLYYTQTPLINGMTVDNLKRNTRRRLKKAKFKYTKQYMDSDLFWMARFTVFAANKSLEITEIDAVINIREDWSKVVAEEYEVLND